MITLLAKLFELAFPIKQELNSTHSLKSLKKYLNCINLDHFYTHRAEFVITYKVSQLEIEIVLIQELILLI